MNLVNLGESFQPFLMDLYIILPYFTTTSCGDTFDNKFWTGWLWPLKDQGIITKTKDFRYSKGGNPEQGQRLRKQTSCRKETVHRCVINFAKKTQMQRSKTSWILVTDVSKTRNCLSVDLSPLVPLCHSDCGQRSPFGVERWLHSVFIFRPDRMFCALKA